MRLLAVYLSLGLVSTVAADVGLAVAEQPAPAGHATVTVAAPVTVVAEDTARDVRAAQARANRDLRRRRLHAIRVRELAQARARAAAAARERAAAARAAAARPRVARSSLAGVPAVWERVAACESGGNWHDNTGNGFYGGLQITAGNAADYGYPRPDTLSPVRQVSLARLILRDQGPGAWPVCGPRAGLRRGD